MSRPLLVTYSLFLLLLILTPLPVHAELYEWTDDSGVVHFSDDPAKVPVQRRTAATREKAKEKPDPPSWVMIAENISGYIYQSFGFYDENGVKKLSANEWVVPVKVIIDNSGLGGIGKDTYTALTFRVLCSPRSASAVDNETRTTGTNQVPSQYSRHPLGAVYHESLIPEHLLDIFCGKTPESVDNTRPGNDPTE